MNIEDTKREIKTGDLSLEKVAIYCLGNVSI